MALTIVDEALLREPNLWVPGKKPIGAVTVDWSNTLFKGKSTLVVPFLEPAARPFSNAEQEPLTPVSTGPTYSYNADGRVSDGYTSTVYYTIGSTSSVGVLKPASNFSVFARVYITGTIDGFHGIIHGHTNNVFDRTWSLMGGATNVIRFYIYNGGWGYAETDAGALPLNTPLNIVGTHDGSTIRIYVNGVLQATTGSKTSVDYGTITKAPRIGNYSGTGFTSGKIALVGITHSVWSSGQIASWSSDPYQFLIPA